MITEKTNTVSGTTIKELRAVNPVTQKFLPGTFPVATEKEIDTAVQEAFAAWKVFRNTSGQVKAQFLRAIAEEIESLGELLVERASEESGLPVGRITGERGRTCNQLRLFASLVEEGSWVEATIDEAIPDRKPLPRADIRKVLSPLGPVAVFTASNFPLAFSTAGGDTASALAAGCPVIVKAHPAHLGTNQLVSEAIGRAIARCGLPEGVFSTLVGEIEVGQALVKHPLITAVGFTGSYRGGKSIFDAANNRPQPIPVYAEMGSINPIFALPEKIKSDAEGLATTLANSVNLGAGQFCTNPGLIVIEKGETTRKFLHILKGAFGKLSPATMLSEGIHNAFNNNRFSCLQVEGVVQHFPDQASGSPEDASNSNEGKPGFASVSASTFLSQPTLHEEVFGPFSLVVFCEDRAEMLKVAAELQGQLTGSIFGEVGELGDASILVQQLHEKVGRLIFNNVPTGVEVCPAMHHGGPFPATTNSLYTSVGTDAIKRFARPVSWQNAPLALLPEALKPGNPLGIWRILNGERVKQ